MLFTATKSVRAEKNTYSNYRHIALPLQGGYLFMSQTQGDGAYAPLPWAVMRRAFSPDF